MPHAVRCIEGCKRETLTTNGLNQYFPKSILALAGLLITTLFAIQACGSGGDSTEVLLRTFGNMGLRHYDGSARSALNDDWQKMLARPRQL